MKRNKMARMIIIVFGCCTLWNTSAHAATESVLPELEVIEKNIITVRTKAGLSISGGTARCSSYVACDSSRSITTTLYLQKYSGGKWGTVKTWTEKKTGSSMSMSKSTGISSGYKYRVKAQFKCGGEITVKYSTTVEY